MNSGVIKFLIEKGYKNISADYYTTYINLWEDWYKNNLDEFHEYYDYYKKKREMYSLGMAKRVCEDWASILFSERDKITTSKSKNKKYLETLKDELNLEKNIPLAIEKSAWSGTCGGIVRVRNAKVEKGILKADENTTRELILVTAKQVIPLRVEHGNIVDVAFVSDTTIDKKKAVYIELHQLKSDGYEVSNIYLDATNGKEIKNDAVLKSFKTGSKDPLFSLLMPPKNNPIDDNNGLGYSVYGDAIDQLKSCDIAYHNFVMDFYLGGKKVIYSKSLIKYTSTTRKVNGVDVTTEVPEYPDDISKQQFMEVGDEFSNKDNKNLIHEYNPELRVEDNQKGNQFALDLLSFKVGFGVKYYQFNGNGIITATEYVGERQDLIENAKKYRDNLSAFIENIIKAGLLLGKLIFGENVTEDCDVLIDNVDGFMEDEESIKISAREDYAMGLISKVEYRMAVYHETEEIAKEMIGQINDESKITSVEVKQ
jgi:A118 family predicted phage portal protein